MTAGFRGAGDELTREVRLLGARFRSGDDRAHERIRRLRAELRELFFRAWSFAGEEHGARDEHVGARRVAFRRARRDRGEERVGAITERFVEKRRRIERRLARQSKYERRVRGFRRRDRERTERARERPLRVVFGTSREDGDGVAERRLAVVTGELELRGLRVEVVAGHAVDHRGARELRERVGFARLTQSSVRGNVIVGAECGHACSVVYFNARVGASLLHHVSWPKPRRRVSG